MLHDKVFEDIKQGKGFRFDDLVHGTTFYAPYDTIFYNYQAPIAPPVPHHPYRDVLNEAADHYRKTGDDSLLRKYPDELIRDYQQSLMPPTTPEQKFGIGRTFGVLQEAIEDTHVFYFDINVTDDEELKATANEFWDEGLLTLPFDKTTFILKDKNSEHGRTVMLVCYRDPDEGEEIGVFPIFPDKGNNKQDNHVCPIVGFVFHPGERIEEVDEDSSKIELNLHAKMSDIGSELFNFTYEEEYMKMKESGDVDKSPFMGFIFNFHNMALSAIKVNLLLLSMKQARRESKEISPKLAKRREKRGKPALKPYTVIRIPDFSKHDDVEREHGSHASPRPHWRRGHIRRYANGKTIPIPPTLVNFDGDDLPDRYYKVESPV